MTRGRSRSSCGDVIRGVLLRHSPDEHYQHYDQIQVFLDFDNVVPTKDEQALYELLEKLLAEAHRLEADLADYGAGASAEVRSAIQNANDAAVQRRAFEAVSHFVRRIKSYYELAQRIEQVVPNLMWELCSGPLSPAEQIDSTQALCKQLARLVDFVFRFDALKMVTPALQNDFSFFRRVISRSELGQQETVVPLEQANIISLFLAHPTPMLNSLSNATIAFVQQHPDLPVANTTETLATIVYICRHMLDREDFVERISSEAQNFFLRVMVGALILFDHIDQCGGAFSRQSPIDMKAVVAAIKRGENAEQTERLMNALRYTTKHFSDQDMPKSIRSLFN